MNDPTSKITIIHREIDGAHFFTSPNVKGLCAAHKNENVAWNALAAQLYELTGKEWAGSPSGAVARIYELTPYRNDRE